MASLKPQTAPLAAPDIRAAKRLVVKIGSALLVDRVSGLKTDWLSALALDVAAAKARGTDVCWCPLAPSPWAARFWACRTEF